MTRGARATIVMASAFMLAGIDLGCGAEPEVPAERPRLSLFATVIGNGNAFAMFNDQAGGGNVSLRVGDVYSGWRLRSIESGRAIFEREGQKANYAVRERASGQLSRPYIAPAPSRAPTAAPAQADKSQSRAAETPSQGDSLPSRGNTDDPIADWFRRQRH
jgi:hypothetical protein